MKKFRAIIIAVIFIAILIFAPVVKGGGFEIEQKREEQIVLEIWNIDNTPGGKNSRSGFLRSVAITYNKSIKNVFFIVKDMTENAAIEGIKQNQSPDLISFGTGFGEKIIDYLKEYNGKVEVADKFIEAGEIKGKYYAVPWCFGGYFLTGNKKEFYSYKIKYLSPFTALYYSKEYVDLDTFYLEESKKAIDEAYSQFLSSSGKFIATNREISKILTKVSNNKMEMPEILPLCGYVDNVVAISITKSCKNEKYSQLFIELLTSNNIQKRLIEINMFSTCGYELYTIEPFKSYEQKEIKRVTHLFTPQESLDKKDSLALTAIKGDKSSQDFLDRFYG